MDPLTQGLLGAVCGQTFYADKLGFKRAAAWGAIAGVLPDVDVVPIAFLGPLAEFRYHRALTHSLWFGLVAGPLLGYLAWRLQQRRGRAAGHEDTLAAWRGLCVVALVTHPLLDWCTTYGTMLLWPSPHRFALDAVAIVDPLYTLILAVALVVGRRVRAPAWTSAAGLAGLVLSTAFLFYGRQLNERAEAAARVQLAPHAGTVQVHAYPTLFQPWLRRIVARADDDVYVGVLSTWKPHPVLFERFTEPRDPRIDAARATPDGALFEWFAMGQTTARVVADATTLHGGGHVEIDDLRYGYGERPDHGLWGVRIPLDAQGRPSGPAGRFNRRPRAALLTTFGLLWRSTFAPGSPRATP